MKRIIVAFSIAYIFTSCSKTESCSLNGHPVDCSALNKPSIPAYNPDYMPNNNGPSFQPSNQVPSSNSSDTSKTFISCPADLSQFNSGSYTDTNKLIWVTTTTNIKDSSSFSLSSIDLKNDTTNPGFDTMQCTYNDAKRVQGEIIIKTSIKDQNNICTIGNSQTNIKGVFCSK